MLDEMAARSQILMQEAVETLFRDCSQIANK
jgi:hypothetical protein